MQKLVTRRFDLVRSIQTGVPVVQSESSDSPWTSGSAANQKGGTRSQRGQPRQIKCWTCIHPPQIIPFKTSLLESHSAPALRLQLPSASGPEGLSAGGATCYCSRETQEKRLFLWDLNKKATKQTNKQIKGVCLTQEPGVMTALAGGLPRMMRPSPHQNYPRGGYSLEGKRSQTTHFTKV